MITKKQLLHLSSAVTILMTVMAASAYAHPSSSHIHKTPAHIDAISEKLVFLLDQKAARPTKHPVRAGVLGEKTGSRSEPVKAVAATMTALDEDISLEGSGCVREHCNCGASTHGNPWCYTNGRGDCPNHQGLLCVWTN